MHENEEHSNERGAIGGASRGRGLRERYDNVTGYMLGIYGRTPRASDFSHTFLPTSDWPLRAGMVFHMYTSAEGIGISETVLVTTGGGERLTRTPRRLLVGGTALRYPPD